VGVAAGWAWLIKELRSRMTKMGRFFMGSVYLALGFLLLALGSWLLAFVLTYNLLPITVNL
jgi:hypothetical protein